ncbi:DUF3515 domain-containing protein [Corynebacterium freiburgense]|uniref:DUF3515 domain-containing protein n=1 Tax=Corynebacterium freiburgense TaxID=556548 RepID=UPI000422DEEE|nr:DUF3515 domain-containing protein [Corynebacterium freiburgense]WJZ02475.1 hypothetical protein CFREI_05920 [Corynebacterium freiburgense]
MSAEQPYHRGPIIIALILAVLLVLGVLFGAKMVYQRAAQQPVHMSTIDAPDADQCAPLLDALPATLLGHPRAELADPAPEGAAAWSSNSQERVTLRCGIGLPLQYTVLSTTTEAAGTSWLRIADATPGSTLETWYAVDRFPIVAVTADKQSLKGAENPVQDLESAMAALSRTKVDPNPAPLVELERQDGESCSQFMNALPKTLGEYTRANVPLEEYMAAWTADGLEPVVLRCGVQDPPGYQPGVQLQQVNNIPWFEDTTLAHGTTASTWYALGRTTNIAVSMPKTAGNTVLVDLGTAIERNINEQARAQ